MENGPTYFVPSIIQFYPTVRLGTTILRLISVISTNQKWTLNAAGHLVVFANHPPQVWFHFQSYQHGLTVQEMLSKPIFQNVLEDPERRTRAVFNLIAQTCWHSKMSKCNEAKPFPSGQLAVKLARVNLEALLMIGLF